jgi:methylated-DNA-[protein]-cysteine S-methyltransferase
MAEMLNSPLKDTEAVVDRFWSGSLTATPVGPISVLVSSAGLAVVEFAGADEFAKLLITPVVMDEKAPEWLEISLSEINDFTLGKRRDFTMPVDLRGMSQFAREVLATTRLIPFGRVRTYGSLAAAAGHPGAARAVGGVMSRNPIPLVIPCHRVVASDGTLHGFSAPGGLKTKSWLLELEGHPMKDLKLKDSSWKNN